MHTNKRNREQALLENISKKPRISGNDFKIMPRPSGFTTDDSRTKNSPATSRDCRCCPICGIVVDGFIRLQKHLAKVHGGLKVSEVKKSSSRDIGLDLSLNLTCSKCGLVCDGEQDLNEHNQKCTTNVLDFLPDDKAKKEESSGDSFDAACYLDKNSSNLSKAMVEDSSDKERIVDDQCSTATVLYASMKPGFNQVLCPLCKLYVFSLEELNNHSIKCHGYISCPICVYCSPMPNMVRHLTSAHPNLSALLLSDFTEPTDGKCKRRTTLNGNKSLDETKKVLCIICGLKVSSSQYLGHFVKSHSDFECTVDVCKCAACSMSFKCFAEFRIHWAQEHDGLVHNVDVLPISSEEKEDD